MPPAHVNSIVNPTPDPHPDSDEADSAAEVSEWVRTLRRAGLAQSPAPRLEALTGGVSSEIILVEDGGRRFVVKRALAKLRVRDDWFADTGRSGVEQAYLRVVGALLPSCVPRVLFADPEAGWFAMEYLGDGFVNWKSQMLAGRADSSAAQRAGEALGVVHRETWGNPDMAAEFATGLISKRRRAASPILPAHCSMRRRDCKARRSRWCTAISARKTFSSPPTASCFWTRKWVGLAIPSSTRRFS